MLQLKAKKLYKIAGQLQQQHAESMQHAQHPNAAVAQNMPEQQTLPKSCELAKTYAHESREVCERTNQFLRSEHGGSPRV